MQISGELSVESESGHRVFGLSRKTNRTFWRREQTFNYYWYRAVSGPNLMIGLVLSGQLFLYRFDVNPCVYALVQAFNVFHCTYMVFYFLLSLYTTNLFILQIIHFFCVKFKCFAHQLGCLDGFGTKKISTRRLARLINDYQRIHLELIEAKDFFKNFLGVNLVFFYFCAILIMFLSIFVDWPIRLALLFTVLVMFLTIIFVPFAFANSLLVKVIYCIPPN